MKTRPSRRLDERVERLAVVVLDRDDDRVRARRCERAHVLGRHERRLLAPEAPGCLLVVGGDADQGALGVELGGPQSGVT